MVPTSLDTHQDKAVLFADVSGSTRLYEALGDELAFTAINTCLDLLRKFTVMNEGRVVKTIGDEIMAVFPDAFTAAHAACEMQLAVSNEPALNQYNVEVRIGFHFGPVIESEGDVFGSTVNMASRMTKIANGQQIITTGTTVDQMPPIMRNCTRSFNTLSIKGKADDIEVREVIWHESDDMTMMMTLNSCQPEEVEPSLQLLHQGKTYQMDGSNPALTIGRDPKADIVVEDKRASRIHARIELRRDKFVFVDMSTNGSYINIKGETELQLRREEFILRESGRISLGHTYLKDPVQVIEFTC